MKRFIYPISSIVVYTVGNGLGCSKIERIWRVFGINIIKYDLRVTKQDQL